MNIIVTFFAFMKYQSNFCEFLACMQIAEKFLERPELASMSFQNDFLKPFVVVMRQSGAKEIRELIIRQVQRSILSGCLSRHLIRSSVVMQSVAPACVIDVRKSVASLFWQLAIHQAHPMRYFLSLKLDKLIIICQARPISL